MAVQAKICGINDPAAMAAAVGGGAAYVGLVFYPPSPRAVTPLAAAELAAGVPVAVKTVGLFVDADDSDIDEVLEAVPLDVLQLHGKETPERAAALKARTGREIMKAVSVADAADLDRARAYEVAVDRLLFDAKPPPEMKNALPGGNALMFDWTLLQGRDWAVPWMLAGGLTPENVAEAVRRTGAGAVDTSSGVEDAPGRKNTRKIHAFLEAVAVL